MQNLRSSVSNHPLAAMHPNKDKLPNLDGLRAVACLFVIMAHLPLPWGLILVGSMGVGIFFVLSGFLMGYLYAESAWDAQSLVKYGIARFSRIAPIYWLVILACIILTKVVPDSFPLPMEGVTTITRHILFSGSVGIFWSIPLEVQYYVFFIFVWWGLAYKLKLPYALPLLIFVCVAFMLTQRYWPQLTVPNKLHFFLAGTIAGMVPRRAWTNATDKLALNLLQVGAMFMLAFPFLMFRNAPGFYDYMPLAFAYAMAIYLLSISSAWTNFLFANPVMRKIGQASFSIYLIHLLILHYGGKLLGLQQNVLEPLWLLLTGFAIVIPMIISVYIEMPLQRITRNFLTINLLSKFQKPQPTTNFPTKPFK
ncbi:MAG: acyltransferase [Gammaproteobacteria bacterium]|nr:MAG: acyltransferase [Gammaproteobacteria bacterium]